MDSSFWANLITMAEGKALDPIALVMEASTVVKGVLVLLLLFFAVSFYIIVYKWIYFRRAFSQSEDFLEAFWGSKRLDATYKVAEDLSRSPIAALFRAGYVELSKIKGKPKDQVAPEGAESMFGQLSEMENIDRALRKAANEQMVSLEGLVQFLATTGSTAPFVGLFGTVWGIMNSFINIGSKGAANLATVAPGIAEALIATALGLVAAVPAVIAYNYFLSKIKVLSAEMDSFSSDFLNITKRHFFK